MHDAIADALIANTVLLLTNVVEQNSVWTIEASEWGATVAQISSAKVTDKISNVTAAYSKYNTAEWKHALNMEEDNEKLKRVKKL